MIRSVLKAPSLKKETNLAVTWRLHNTHCFKFHIQNIKSKAEANNIETYAKKKSAENETVSAP